MSATSTVTSCVCCILQVICQVMPCFAKICQKFEKSEINRQSLGLSFCPHQTFTFPKVLVAFKNIRKFGSTLTRASYQPVERKLAAFEKTTRSSCSVSYSALGEKHFPATYDNFFALPKVYENFSFHRNNGKVIFSFETKFCPS